MNGRDATLLVVDDDRDILHLLESRLAAAGHRVLAASSAAAALLLVSDRAVDMVISDINMPGMDGFELLAAIRRQRAPAELPVIMLSARGSGEDVIQALRLGANDYAVKPVCLPELAERIEAHLALRAVDGQVVQGYRLVRRLGAGAMGVVCEAVELASGRSVALKILRRSLRFDPQMVQRFVREAELAGRVEHPNVVRTLAAGVDGETYFIVMELVPGHDLADLQRGRPLELSAALGITRQITLALDAMAGVGVVHRDIKPENVIVADDGTAKVTDFGIAHDLSQSRRLTEAGRGVGTLVYASPEQMRGRADTGSDVYGLGCTLFMMLTGEDPFDPDWPVDRLWREKTRSPRRVTRRAAGLPRIAARLIEEMIAPRPADRPSGSEVRATTEALLAGETPRLRRRAFRRELALAVAAGVATAFALSAWLLR